MKLAPLAKPTVGPTRRAPRTTGTIEAPEASALAAQKRRPVEPKERKPDPARGDRPFVADRPRHTLSRSIDVVEPASIGEVVEGAR